MVVNFTCIPVTPLLVSGSPIDFVDTFKYLGVTFDVKMSFKHHVDTIVAKCNQRLYLLRNYATFGASSSQKTQLFKSMILSVILYACQSYYSALAQKQKVRLQRIANRAKIQIDIQVCAEVQQLKYVNKIVQDHEHLLFSHFVKARSGRRYLLPKCRTEKKKGADFQFNQNAK